MNPSDAPPQFAPHVESGTVRYGVALTFETVGAFCGAAPPVRLRPREDVLLRVIDGALRVVIGDDEDRVLAPGEEAIVAAGSPHRLSGVDGDARFILGLRTRRY